MTAIPSIKDNYGSNVKILGVYGANWKATIFTAASSYIATSVRCRGDVTGSPGTATASLRLTNASHQPTGADLCVGSVNANGWVNDWHDIPFNTPYPITAGTEYAIVLRAPSGNGSNYLSLYDCMKGAPSDVGSSDWGVTWGGAGNFGWAYQVWGCAAPICSSANAINVTSTSTQIQGTIDSMGDYSPVYAYFEYGLTALYGSLTPEQTFTTPDAFFANLSGLIKGTTYHYRGVLRYA
jgi:hypothetical protein